MQHHKTHKHAGMDSKGLRKRVTEMSRDELEHTLLSLYDSNNALKAQYHVAENKAKLCVQL